MNASTESLALRIGAVLALLGAAATAVSGALHPSLEAPDDHPRVFVEYARSEIWVTGHLIQTYGFLFAFLALVVLGHALAQREGRARVFATLGMPLAVSGIAVAAVLQGLDTVALKAATVKWEGASSADRSATFAAAEVVRYLEVGFNSIFRMLQGSSYAVLGLALAHEKGWARWLGWSAVVLGLAIVARGFAVAYTGFSLANPLYSTVGGVALNALNIWLIALAVFLWRSASPKTDAT